MEDGLSRSEEILTFIEGIASQIEDILAFSVSVASQKGNSLSRSEKISTIGRRFGMY